MKKFCILLYGTLSYVAFMVAVLYVIAFTGNIGGTFKMDAVARLSFFQAITIDILLLVLFAGLQSFMLGPGFKKMITRHMPRSVDRSSYVLLCALGLFLLMWLWQPVDVHIWKVKSSALKSILMIAYLSGWAIILFSTFLINHADLFGMRQVWMYYEGKPYELPAHRLPVLNRIVRRPLYLGFLLAFWSAPVMSVSHLLVAMSTTLYIVIAVISGEHNLFVFTGDKNRQHRNQNPVTIHFSKKRIAGNK